MANTFLMMHQDNSMEKKAFFFFNKEQWNNMQNGVELSVNIILINRLCF